jgi:hypothetical protein
MDKVIDPQPATRKGIIIGVVATLIVLGVGAGLPFWWYSSGRDMQTFHDGLSTNFRHSVAKILMVEGYDAMNAYYDQSDTITKRDFVLKYGERPSYKDGQLKNYIRWQGEIEYEKQLFDIVMRPANNPAYSYPENRTLLNKIKANGNQKIEKIQAAHAMLAICREAVIRMVQDPSGNSDSDKCTPVPEK